MKIGTLIHVSLRSFFLEASWNNQEQQNLGLAAAIDPALKAIYGSSDELWAARERALGFFNTNPIASGISIGVAINLEEALQAGRLVPSDRERMMTALNYALASLGDAFFWQSWLPLCCLISVWAVLSFTSLWWAPLLLPGFFCILAVPVRFSGLYLGYRLGLDIFNLLEKFKINQWARYLKLAMALLVGVSTVVLVAVNTGLYKRGSTLKLWTVIGGVVAGVFALRLLSSRTKRFNYWYPVILVALAAMILAVKSRF